MTDILNQLLTFTGILSGAYLLAYCIARGWKHGMGKPNRNYDVYFRNTEEQK